MSLETRTVETNASSVPADDASIRLAADALYEAMRDGRPCTPVRGLFADDRDIETAYAVQEYNRRRFLAEGRVAVGHKIGLTAAVVQKQLGVDQPDFGVLYADTRVEDGGEVELSRLIQAKVEGEIAFVLKRDLDKDRLGLEDVIAATDYVSAAIEIVDSRIRNWDIRLLDTVADNASSGLFVLGEERRGLEGLDLTALHMTLSGGDGILSQGTGADCMGSPALAMVWLARKAVSLGRPLRAGDVVLSGALGPMMPVTPGSRFVVAIEHLGEVSVGFGN
ncbi:MAG: fumarylacetoacetate hydrolase family protein [Acidobacteriota bacterium]|nr:fumarylacetoacetate hydrolase family protein [Acidobacteriota bacterium]